MSPRKLPTEVDIEALLMRILKIPPDRYTALSRDVVDEWDSLKHMELIFALEDEYEVRFDESEFAKLTSARAIAAAVRKHLAS